MTEDYQWPSFAVLPKRFDRDAQSVSRRAVNHIESAFSTRAGADAVLLSSGRAAIAMVLDFLNVGRAQTVFAPRYSSFCLWDVIGRRANPSSSLSVRADVVLAVHKWGRVEKLKSPERHGLVIEDSVDSIFEERAEYFPNSGVCEIVSLPKVMGTYYGAIVITRDSALAENLRDRRKRNRELARHQANLRFAEATGKKIGPYEAWANMESRNTALDASGVDAILKCLPELERNADLIRARMEIVRATLGDSGFSMESGRLPPVLSFVLAGKGFLDPEIMIRSRNYSPFLDEPAYKPSAILPLHFGVSDPKFMRLLTKFADAKERRAIF